MPTKIRRALFIGLGGTGMKTLLHTKKIIYDNYGEIPPMLAFIGIDTDRGSYSNTLEARDGTPISLDTPEQLRIGVANPSDIYSVGRRDGKFGWIAPGNENALTVLQGGAGQTRSNGRFAITERESDVKAHLRAKRDQITNALIMDSTEYQILDCNAIDVHVIFSLSGGTGGGTFINLAYLAKEVFPECKISGYAVTAGVFLTMLRGAPVDRVRSNSYGAILDLDYLMSLTLNTSVQFECFSDTKSVNRRPFNALYLIDNRNRNNDTYASVDQISEMISLALVTSIGQLGVAADSVADNVDKIIAEGSMDMKGKRAWVAGLGVSEIVYGGKSLADIYANKARTIIISMLTNGGCDDPSNIANNWIDTNSIRENLGKNDVIDYFIESPQPTIPLVDIDQPRSPQAECDSYIQNISQVRDEDLNRKLEQLKERVENSLRKLMDEQMDRECGAYLCENVLKTLLNQFQLCDGEMEAEIEELNDSLPLKKSALETSQKELEVAMGKIITFGKERRIQNVCENAVIVATCLREIKRRRMARVFYAWLITSVNGYINKVDVLLRNLRAVVEEGSANVERIRQGMGNISIFQHDLAISMVDNVNCTTKDIVFNDFVIHMRQQGGLWQFANLGSTEVARLIWNYTSELPQARNYRDQTIDDVLGSLGADELDRVCRVTINKAQPLLRTDSRGYHATSAPDNSYYVGVAKLQSSVLSRNGFFRSRIPELGANVNIVPIGLNDRVIIFHQYGVVPAFTVSAIDDYVAEYEQRENMRPGASHWDYPLYLQFKKERFDLMPRDTAAEGEIRQWWVQALLFGLVTRNDRGEFFMKSSELGGRPIEGYQVKMGGKRIDAFGYFAKNLSIVKNEMDKRVNDLVENDRALPVRLRDKARKEVSEGVYHLPGHLSLNDIDFTVEENKTLYREEYDLLDKEIEYILSMK